MTKQEEIDHWTAFVAGLPDGYLRSMFGDSVGYIESEIRNDMAYCPLPAMRREQAEVASDLKMAKAELVMVRQQLKDDELKLKYLAREQERTKEGIEGLRLTARRLAGM